MFNFQGVGVYGYNMLCQVIYVEFMVYDWVGAGYSPIVPGEVFFDNVVLKATCWTFEVGTNLGTIRLFGKNTLIYSMGIM